MCSPSRLQGKNLFPCLFQHLFLFALAHALSSIFKVSNEECVVTLANGQSVRLVVYNAMARLRERVQSLVAVPDSNWTNINQYQLFRPNYLVSPASMAHVIKKKYDRL